MEQTEEKKKKTGTWKKKSQMMGEPLRCSSFNFEVGGLYDTKTFKEETDFYQKVGILLVTIITIIIPYPTHNTKYNANKISIRYVLKAYIHRKCI